MNGGPLILENTEAWCVPCNLQNGPRDADDPRVEARDWQVDALPVVLERIAGSGVATVAAAPGSGKTIFASLVFEYLRAARFVDRIVVFTPNKNLVKQWHLSLLTNRHIEIRPGGEVEREGELGVVQTYQSLGSSTVRIHKQAARTTPTLLVLDEVHHIGESRSGLASGWARHIADLAGDVDDELHVRAILNLSGTLWRSNPNERISTVRYIADGDKILSAVDYRVEAAELIRQGILRGVDLFRRSSRVELVNYGTGRQVEGEVADLDEEQGRAALRELDSIEEWRDGFVDSVLERLEVAHRDLGNGPAKALIVARTIEAARAFQVTANERLRARGIRGAKAVLAVSDEPDAQEVLAEFRKSETVGVLCTVGMAGEGYDCPWIAVVGFATNKLTSLYVRQVVARGQRVTDYEREVLKRPIAAAVVLPEIPELIARMSELLEPIRHELSAMPESPITGDDGVSTRPSTPQLSFPEWQLVKADDHRAGDIRVLREDGPRDVNADLVAAIALRLRASGRLRESDAPLIASILNDTTDMLPFDTASAIADVEASPPPKSTRPLSVEERNNLVRDRLTKLRGWYVRFGPPDDVGRFVALVHKDAGIAGSLKDANVEQLERAYGIMSSRIRDYCQRTDTRPPRQIEQG